MLSGQSLILLQERIDLIQPLYYVHHPQTISIFYIFYKENFLFCWVKLSHDGGRCKHKSANVLLHTATHLINWMHLKGWETEGWRQNILKILKRSSTASKYICISFQWSYERINSRLRIIIESSWLILEANLEIVDRLDA